MAVKEVMGERQDRQTRRVPAMVEILPLEPADRLMRHEFERRYHAMPHIKKAELIEGVVYMPSPVRASHSRAHGEVMIWLGTYRAATPGVELYDNATVRLDAENEVQPDALLRLDEAMGGRSRISADDYLEGAPELIVEVAATSAAYDLYDVQNSVLPTIRGANDKLRVYRRNRVQEYVVWQVYDRRVDWFRLSEGEYVPLEPDAAGVVHSQMFPGLHLAVPALLDGDLATVLAELRKGLGTAEYAAFVERLLRTPLG